MPVKMAPNRSSLDERSSTVATTTERRNYFFPNTRMPVSFAESAFLQQKRPEVTALCCAVGMTPAMSTQIP